jgi:chemotaxis protein MotB
VARRRRQQREEHENLERWLVSYADFVTLLFAFFVVMYAISSVNEGKYRVLSDTLTEAFRDPAPTSQPARGQARQPLAGVEPVQLIEAGPVGSTSLAPVPDTGIEAGILPAGGGTAIVGGKGRAENLDELAASLEDELQTFVGQRLVEINKVGDTIEVAMKSQLLFDSGSARLAPAALPALDGLGRVLVASGNAIRVEGHTDDRPINTLQFPSNWELSAARAASVVHFLMRLGIAPERMAAIGYGEHRPVADNLLEEGRQRNRRVTLVILGTKDQPVPVGPDVAPTPVAADAGASPGAPGDGR